MANIQQFDEEKDKNQPTDTLATPAQQQAQLSTGTANVSNAASTAAPVAGGTPTPSRRTSGRFTNISQYVGANQGAGQQLAQGIQQNVGQAANKVTTGIQNADTIKQNMMAEQNRLAKAGQYVNTIQAVGQGRPVTPQAIQQNMAAQNAAPAQPANPMAQYGLQDTDIQAVGALRTGQTNVNDLEKEAQNTVSTINQDVNNVQNLANKSASEAGRFDLLRQTYGRPGYNQGSQRLDQLFVQAGGGQTLNNLQRNLKSTAQQGQQALGTLNNEFTQNIGNIRTGVDQAKQQILGALGGFGKDNGGALGNVYTELETDRNAAIKDQDELVKGAQLQLMQFQSPAPDQMTTQAVKDPYMDADIAAALGINGDLGIGAMDLTNWKDKITVGDTNITQADIAKQQQLDRINILKQLAGLQDGEINLGPKEGTQGISFDKDGFVTEANRSQGVADDRFNNTKFETTQLASLMKGELGKYQQEITQQNNAMLEGILGKQQMGGMQQSPQQRLQNLENQLRQQVQYANATRRPVDPATQQKLDQIAQYKANVQKQTDLSNFVNNQQNGWANFLKLGQYINTRGQLNNMNLKDLDGQNADMYDLINNMNRSSGDEIGGRTTDQVYRQQGTNLQAQLDNLKNTIGESKFKQLNDILMGKYNAVKDQAVNDSQVNRKIKVKKDK